MGIPRCGLLWPRKMTMLNSSSVTIAICLVALTPSSLFAQSPASAPGKPATAAVLGMITGIEKTLNAVAEEMPGDKYDFAPTEGSFRGVRNFGRQLKHAAAVQHLVAATILGERVTADMADERGPDSVRTKAEVQQYVKESFAALRRAAATIDDANAFVTFKGPFGEGTRIGLIVTALSHSWNHYGQVVPYLRMNGIIPPRTQ